MMATAIVYALPPVAIYNAFHLKAAKALGLTIPQSLVLRADRVIE